MALRYREPVPVPYDDLVAIQQRLGHDHDSALWEGDDLQVLVARVPGEVPDFVNDLERIAEKADAADVARADRVLLVAERGVHQVPVNALRQLVTDRRTFDRAQVTMLRTQLPGRLSHTFYRSPGDPKRHLRLGVRVPCQHVADVDDDILEALVEQIGPRLAKGVKDVRCVYLVAAEDDVRLDAARFLQDLSEKWRDESRRAEIARQARAAEEAKRAREERERSALIGRLEDRYGKGRVAFAPMHRSRSGIGDLHATVDALPAPTSVAMTDAEAKGPAPDARDPATARARVAAALAEPLPEPVGKPEPIRTGDEDLDRLAAVMQGAGYEVRVRPDVPGHTLDLAAERTGDYPERVVARAFDRLRGQDAEAVLHMCHELDVDIAVVVAEAAEPEAQRRIVATKVKWLRPREVAGLRL